MDHLPPDGRDDGAGEDPAVAAFSALQGEVAEAVMAIGGLQAQFAALREGLEELRQREPPQAPDYNETLGVLARTVQEVGGQVAAIGVTLTESVAGLERDFARTRQAVKDAATEAREAAGEAAERARDVREALLSDRTTVVLMLLALLVMAGVGLGSGWGLRGWWAPPPAGVFARYLAAGNDPNWLLCEGGGKRFTAQNQAEACELRFWLQNPGP